MEGDPSGRSLFCMFYIPYNQQNITCTTSVWERYDCTNLSRIQLKVSIPTFKKSALIKILIEKIVHDQIITSEWVIKY